MQLQQPSVELSCNLASCAWTWGIKGEGAAAPAVAHRDVTNELCPSRINENLLHVHFAVIAHLIKQRAPLLFANLFIRL